MKLFLSSISIVGELRQPFFELVGKEAKDIKFCLIENAADLYKEEVKGFMYKTRADIEGLGMQVERLDLNQYKGKQEELKEKLERFDVVWIGGGNTYYIRSLLKQTGFDQIITGLLENGLVYGGGSAGAIVAGSTIKEFQEVDEPENGLELIEEGLGLTDIVIVPHWQTPKYQDKLDKIKEHYEQTHYKVMTLTDSQALVADGDECKLFPNDSTSLTIDSYDRVAKAYAGEFFEDDSDNHHIDAFLELLPSGGKVLDAGCGPGNYSAYIAQKGFEVIGVDLSKGMLEIARENVPDVTFLQEDLRNLSFESGSFDGICAAYSLIHLPVADTLPVLKKFFSLLRAGGVVFLALQEGEQKEIQDTSFGKDNILVHSCYTETEITELLEQANFKVITATSRPPHENEVSHNKLFIIARKNV